jgi:hypothetical protein
MNFWALLSHAAWAIAIVLFAWILVDALRVSRTYDDDFLTSSTEGSE